MMKKLIVAFVAACALCCLPLLVPAIAGLSVFGLQMFGKPVTLDAMLCAVTPALLAGIAVFAAFVTWRHFAGKAKCQSSSCQAAGKCGCK